MTQTEPSAEDYLRPKLEGVIADAQRAGYTRDVVLAVLIDLLDDRIPDQAELARR